MYSSFTLKAIQMGEQTCLVYRLQEGDVLDFVETEMLKSNEIKGILPFSNMQNNDDITLLYNITNKISLKQLMGGIVRWEDLTRFVCGLAHTIVGGMSYMLDQNHFLLNEECIYIDTETREPEFVFLPLLSEKAPKVNWRRFLLSQINGITYDNRDSREKLALLKTYIIDNNISLMALADKVAGVKKVQKEEKEKTEPTMFVPDPVVEEKLSKPLPEPDFNVPQNPVSGGGVPAAPPLKEKSGGLPGFGRKAKKEKKVKKEKKSRKKTPAAPALSGMGFEVPGQENALPVVPKEPAKAEEQMQKLQKSQKPAKKFMKQTINENAILPDPKRKNTRTMPELEEVGATVLVEEDMGIEPYVPVLMEKRTSKIIPVDKPEFRIGRQIGAVDYVVKAEYVTVGRFHANIVLDIANRRAFIRDANSKNGTYLNGQRIQSNINVELKSGCEIRLGNEEYVFIAE